jgi:hypothetical protein
MYGAPVGRRTLAVSEGLVEIKPRQPASTPVVLIVVVASVSC